jgi:hypothetical protein
MLLSALSPLWAQIDNGNMTGRVTDSSGAAIVGAQVTVTQTEMNFTTSAVTNERVSTGGLICGRGQYRRGTGTVRYGGTRLLHLNLTFP